MDERRVQDRITAFWSAVGPHYNADPANVAAVGTPEYDAWVDAFASLFPPATADVLDVGAGTGFVAMIAAGLGHRVVGIDLAEGMLEVARADAAARGSGVSWTAGDAVAPPFQDASFDVVVNRSLLWTLREPERACANWLRLLRPGGRVVAIHSPWGGMPDGDEREGFFEQHYTKQLRDTIPGMNTDSIEPFVRMLRDAGFDDVTATKLDVGPFALTGRHP